ncbi:MAG: hypothetical protein V4480_00750 [Patescibacteria group bacterium]
MSKTITDIIPPSRRRRMEAENEQAPEMEMDEPAAAYVPPRPPRPVSDRPYRANSGGPRRFPWAVALVALIVVIGSAAALYAFAGAKVTITPTSTTANVSGDFTATFASGDLPYELITVDKTVAANVPAESTETVNDPAQGTITIMNAQSTPQTLIKNTRFQSPDGLIFRIQDSVTIPGGSISSPGSVQAPVSADTGGEQYNIAPTTFTVPGLKGSKSFDLVTAKSTEAMAGGFSGTRPSVGQATRDAQNEKSKTALTSSISDEVISKLQSGYVVIPGATFITYTPTNDTAGKDNTVNVNLKGTAVAVAMPQAALAKAISYRVNGSYAGQPVSLTNPQTLAMTPSSPGTPTAEQGSFAFSLTGPATITWDVDAAKIAGAVAGKSRSAAYTIIQGFPEVAKAVLNIRPFWAGTFPQDPANIIIATTTPQN